MDKKNKKKIKNENTFISQGVKNLFKLKYLMYSNI